MSIKMTSQPMSRGKRMVAAALQSNTGTKKLAPICRRSARQRLFSRRLMGYEFVTSTPKKTKKSLGNVQVAKDNLVSPVESEISTVHNEVESANDSLVVAVESGTETVHIEGEPPNDSLVSLMESGTGTGHIEGQSANDSLVIPVESGTGVVHIERESANENLVGAVNRGTVRAGEELVNIEEFWTNEAALIVDQPLQMHQALLISMMDVSTIGFSTVDDSISYVTDKNGILEGEENLNYPSDTASVFCHTDCAGEFTAFHSEPSSCINVTPIDSMNNCLLHASEEQPVENPYQPADEVINAEVWGGTECKDVSQNNTSTVQTKKSRKRLRKTFAWKRNEQKAAKMRGEGKLPAKSGTICKGKCRLKCSELSTDVCNSIHEAYYGLDQDAKNAYLFGLIEAYRTKMRKTSSDRPKTWSFAYYVTVSGRRRRVCKYAFCALHSIGRSKVKHITEQVAAGQPTVTSDQRGRHSNRPNRLTDDDIEFVKQHISSFPAELSHYSRAKNSNRQYLSAMLSVQKMHDEYITVCQAQKVKPVSMYSYRYIFTTHFNLGFGSPKSDTCSACDNLDSISTPAHKERANEAFEQQKSDKKISSESQQIYITFDLQQTLPLPKLSTSKAFYLRQVWLYNLGVHLLFGKTNRAYFHIWAENEGGRGCSEVGSALLAFLDSSNCLNKSKHLVAWSDSCSGQNKNFVIVCLWQLLLLRGFEIIDHKFPEPGHTFLDSDRDFAHVEQNVRKHENVYSIDEYQEIMLNSVRNRTVSVTRMADKFYDLQQLPQHLGLKQAKSNTEGEKIPFRDGIRWIRTCKFGEYNYRCSFSEEEEWKTVKLSKETSCAHSSSDLTSLLVPTGTQRALNSKKVTDVKKQLCFIPPTYRQFYMGLVSNDTQTEDNLEEAEEAEEEVDEQPKQPDNANGNNADSGHCSSRKRKACTSSEPNITGCPRSTRAKRGQEFTAVHEMAQNKRVIRRKCQTTAKKN